MELSGTSEAAAQRAEDGRELERRQGRRGCRLRQGDGVRDGTVDISAICQSNPEFLLDQSISTTCFSGPLHQEQKLELSHINPC